ncbi:Beige/BEACH domain containing protein [Trichomonas vaginalis G3]|uniref:Beige/BEACH domain containing protein n=1 Tax=Trichomonas vaginalis (strain ATCC PRA-98 / G3) TaxID=412133 RepID=A2FKN2_TRIV3|nr:platelet formation protein family [Trichomonas vaginalis G3]EAX94530.1 Beige/BEACH domain containing protein [Trichomonas vaginalis G3]KAI5534846.1 platelet formation protein family [Trichomonas vaginalis G3]|eukprot:XP_001307460.1 Beige/BEACH domain containing protein [Trichomonas vaginalis G3]
MTSPQSEYCNIVFNQLFKTETKEISQPKVDFAKSSDSQQNFEFNNLDLMTSALMAVSSLPDDNEANKFTTILQTNIMKKTNLITDRSEWDIPFIIYLMDKIPHSINYSEIPLSCMPIITILSQLYSLTIYKNMDRINAIVNTISYQVSHDYSHISRLVFSAMLKMHILQPTHAESVTNKYIGVLFRSIFEYLFFIPNTSKFFLISTTETAEKQDYKQILYTYLHSTLPKFTLCYQVRTNEKFIWEDAELADLYLLAIESFQDYVFQPTNSLLKLPDLYLIYAFTLSIGLEHKIHFTTFQSHIRILTKNIPTKKKLTGAYSQLWIIYMAGLLHTYMVTDRNHTSHIYLQEDATSFSRNIYNNYGMKLRWGESIDSFDSCFKEYGHHFAYTILEEFSEIENQFVEYSKVLAKDTVQFYQDIVNNVDIINKSYENSKNLLKDVKKQIKQSEQPSNVPELHYKLFNRVYPNNLRNIFVEDKKFNEKQEEKPADYTEFLKQRASPVEKETTDQRKDKNIKLRIPAKLVKLNKAYDGVFTVTNEAILFDYSKKLRIILDDINGVYFRTFLLLNTAIEVFTRDYHAYFFDFAPGNRQSVIEAILTSNNRIPFVQTSDNDIKKRIVDVQEKWCGGQMTNFDYILNLNILAGRSYNDVCQYPIFPWVIKDFDSQSLDLNAIDTYRDLTQRIQKCDIFISPQFVLRNLDFKNDCDINELWESQKTELIPEYFYMSEILTNQKLPKWAQNSSDFITKNRMALESPYVTAKLNNWIDTIFGITSRLNTDQIFFEEVLTEEVKSDKGKLTEIQEFISQNGQGCKKLFTEKHPFKRMINPPFTPCPRTISVFYEFSSSPVLVLDHFDQNTVRVVSQDLTVMTYSSKSLSLTKNKLETRYQIKQNEFSTVCLKSDKIIWSLPFDAGFNVTDNNNETKLMPRIHNDMVTAISVDKNIVLIGNSDKKVSIWKNEEFIYGEDAHDSKVTCVSLLVENDMAVSCSKKGEIMLSMISNGKKVKKIKENKGTPIFCRMMHGGYVFVAFNNENMSSLALYDINLKLITSFATKEKFECVNVFEWNAGSSFAVFTLKNSKLAIVHMPMGKLVWSKDSIDFNVTAIDYIAEFNLVLFGTKQGKVMTLALFD